MKLSKRTIIALVTALLSLLGCATKVVVDGISVEIADNSCNEVENGDKFDEKINFN